MIRIRALSAADIPLVDPLLMAAYGNPQSFVPRLERLLRLEPDGWIVAEEEGRPLGTGGATMYGTTAYVGLVAVDPGAQSRGIGRALMVEVLARLAARGASTILLDASDAGRPLYEKLGFVTDDGVGLWRREVPSGAPGGAAEAVVSAAASAAATAAVPGKPRPRDGGWKIEPLVSAPGATGTRETAAALAELASLDESAWGAGRGRLLRDLAADPTCAAAGVRGGDGEPAGYAFLQAGQAVVGPLVAREAGAAKVLLDWALEEALLRRITSPLTAYLPVSNAEGAAVLAARGFALQRSLAHMRLGPALPAGRRRLVYSQASFALG
ncbi:MAG: GNAT family N-acetyltransferase [Spirochaetaceae bacterium]|nr:GNAT family N-acetyltransferase [Spirochaetaceae bacterium]